MSLRSLVQKGRFYCDWGKTIEAQEDFSRVAKWLMAIANERDTILVNAQSVLDDIVPPDPKAASDEALARLVEYTAIPRPKPPYEHMWLEARLENPPQRIAAVTERFDVRDRLGWWLENTDVEELEARMIIEDKPDTIVTAMFIHDWEGSPAMSGTVVYWMDNSGKFLRSVRIAPYCYHNGHPVDEKFKARQTAILHIRQGWMLHTFARMNCANARLVEMPNGFQPKHGHRHRQAPFSVWHEIQISDAPKTRHATTAVSPQQNPDSVRFHRVRGHYADYTKGAGLFGNPKLRAVFWIPEHHAGKEEVGTVVSSYQIV